MDLLHRNTTQNRMQLQQQKQKQVVALVTVNNTSRGNSRRSKNNHRNRSRNSKPADCLAVVWPLAVCLEDRATAAADNILLCLGMHSPPDNTGAMTGGVPQRRSWEADLNVAQIA